VVAIIQNKPKMMNLLVMKYTFGIDVGISISVISYQNSDEVFSRLWLARLLILDKKKGWKLFENSTWANKPFTYNTIIQMGTFEEI
jgi:hypothetical protein